jgi:ABC-type multidrug transport system fused ATPase/permease subunit
MRQRRFFNQFFVDRTAAFRGELRVVRNCFILLSKLEIFKLRIVSVAQLVLALLDFIGVLLIGLIGMLSVYGIQSREPSDQVKFALRIMGIQEWSLQSQVFLVGMVAAALLVSKTLISAWINRRTIRFLANRSAGISSRLIERLAFSSMEQIKKRTRFENIYALTNGVQSITVGVIGTFVSLFADVVLIIVMFTGLLVVDSSIALTSVILFGSIAFVLYRMVNSKVSQLARDEASLQIRNNQLLYELFGSYREIFASGMRVRYTDNLTFTRRQLADISAESAFIPLISKYVLEVAFVFGAVCFVGSQFALKDAVGAISSISIFIASTGRIIPAILRVQGAALTFRGALSGASRTLEVIEELKEFENPFRDLGIQNRNLPEFDKQIIVNDVSFTYISGARPALQHISMSIRAGEWLAIVGPSAAGKTTLVDILLGLLRPTSGKLTLSGLEPEEAISSWPGKIAYVPQDCFILEGSIQQNVALGVSDEDIDHNRVLYCLEKVGLLDLIAEERLGVDFKVGELGSKLSGGQRQRLGIARALYTAPELLVLDEATSALDTISEKIIVDFLREIQGKTTVISIAHRLSTVTNADRVIYLERGMIVAEGTFQEVRKQVPNFNKQAQLAGIEELH